MKNNVCILGDGGWGTALAILLHRQGARVSLWGAFPDYLAEVSRTRVNRKFLPS
ncbi:MAG: glycerol-3-phosphate dehydrogenase, partial [Candidatus Aureabacteria bacterium]|nr:glycerol-3-phosphate dehydrogenase [Candidatus Auribacterota bacterium]